MVQRGLLLFGMMLVIVTMVGLVIFRSRGTLPPEDTSRAESPALVVPNPSGTFPASLNWAAIYALSQNIPSSPGWEVRYNAALTLARRGSTNVPLDVLCQMLDEDQQLRNFRIRTAEGKTVINEYGARRTVFNGLQAVELWHKHKEAVQAVGAGNPQLQRLYAGIDTLTQCNNEALRQEASRVKKAIGGS